MSESLSFLNEALLEASIKYGRAQRKWKRIMAQPEQVPKPGQLENYVRAQLDMQAAGDKVLEAALAYSEAAGAR